MFDEAKENRVYKKFIKTKINEKEDTFCPLRKEKQMDYLFSFLKDDFKIKNLKILDVCSGYGRLIYYLNEFDSEQYYTGIDYLKELIERGKKLFLNSKNIKFECYDAFKLSKKYEKEFDISINYKTLSWLPYYENLLTELFKVTKNKIYVTSLFWDGDIDFITKIYLNAKNNKNNFTFLNTYSFPKFKEFCLLNGAKFVYSSDMKIDFSLGLNDQPDLLKTYTVLDKNNNYLEFTGNVLLNWKLIEIVL